MTIIGREFVSDKTVYALSNRYPAILAFYKESNVWCREPAICGWSAPVGSVGFFQSL